MSESTQRVGQMMWGIHQLIIPFTEQEMDLTLVQAVLGDAHTEITPLDRQQDRVKIYTKPNLDSYWLSFDSTADIPLPNVMTALTATYENGGGDTNYTETGSDSASGSYHVGVSVSGQCQASAFSIPKLVPTITETWSSNLPVKHYFYFGSAFDIATVLSKLSTQLATTVNAWPVFHTATHKFTLFGTRVNATGRASCQGTAYSHTTGASASFTQGLGEGLDISPVIEVMQIPSTLHGSFSFTGTGSSSHNAVAAITISGSPISGGGGGTATAAATSSITPNTLAATTPSALPVSGLYLYKFDIEPAEIFGYFYAHAIVFDFSVL